MANLLTNGDFELGNTGFVSNFAYAGIITGNDQYSITTDPSLVYGDWPSIVDNTSGSGNMLVSKAVTHVSIRIWFDAVSVLPYTDYRLLCYIYMLDGPEEMQLQLSLLESDFDNVIDSKHFQHTVSDGWMRFN